MVSTYTLRRQYIRQIQSKNRYIHYSNSVCTYRSIRLTLIGHCCGYHLQECSYRVFWPKLACLLPVWAAIILIQLDPCSCTSDNPFRYWQLVLYIHYMATEEEDLVRKANCLYFSPSILPVVLGVWKVWVQCLLQPKHMQFLPLQLEYTLGQMHSSGWSWAILHSQERQEGLDHGQK